MKRMQENKTIKHLILMTFLSIILAMTTLADINPFGSVSSNDEEILVEIDPRFSTTAVQPGENVQAALVVDIVPGWHINSADPGDENMIGAELNFDTLSGITPHSIVYPTGEQIELIGQEMSVYDNRAIIIFSLSIDPDVAPGEYNLPLSFTSQPCNNRSCLPPKTLEGNLTFTVGVEGRSINEAIFGQISDIEQESIPAEEAEPLSEIDRLVNEYGFWGYIIALGLAFVTGLVLSFSPCTYPMIPITVSIFAGQQRSLGRGFVLSLFYVGSMAVVYGLMGLIVSLVGGVFGAWLASPPVVIGMVVVFIIFALSMFGLYDLNLPMSWRQKLGTAKSSGGVAGAIVLGVVAALVVSPCVGPFVAGILLYIATSGSALLGFLTLFVFAIGLGTLFIIIGTFSTAINKLPNSGAWMETVKKFFGFILLLMALYFLRTLVSSETLALLTGLLLLSFSVFGGGLDRLTTESGFFDRLKKFLGIITLILGAYLLLGTLFSQGFIYAPISEWLPASSGVGIESHKNEIRWETDLETALTRAKTENKPVLIDTWAIWCINCKVLEKKTFGHLEVIEEAKRFIPVKVQLEKADSPITLNFKERFGLKQYSLPTTLLLEPSGKVKKIMQGVVEPDIMLAEMRKL